MRTTRSQVSRTSRRSPRALGPEHQRGRQGPVHVRVGLLRHRPPGRSSRHWRISTRRRRARCSPRSRSARCASAPAEALPTTPSRAAEWRVCRMTPLTPAASHVRRIAPTLCGSSIPSRTTISGCRVAGTVGASRRRIACQLLDRVVRRLRDLGDDPLVHAAARRALQGLRVRALDRDALRAGQRQHLVHALVRARAHAQPRHFLRAQRLEDRVDSVDQHPAAPLRAGSAKLAARSKCLAPVRLAAENPGQPHFL